MLHLQKNILFEIKKYLDDITNNQSARKYAVKKGLSKNFIDIYSKKDPHPITECSEYYLDDKEFILEAVKIDPECLKYASKRLKEDLDIIKVVFKKRPSIAKKQISKEILKQFKSK
jgi:hypothetical protein